MKLGLGLFFIGIVSILGASESYYKNGKLVSLENMHSSRAYAGSYISYYKNARGQKIGITDEILVECNDGIDCSRFLETYNIVEYSKLTQKIYILKVEDYDNIFSLSRTLFETGKVKYAHPNFIQERKLR